MMIDLKNLLGEMGQWIKHPGTVLRDRVQMTRTEICVGWAGLSLQEAEMASQGRQAI